MITNMKQKIRDSLVFGKEEKPIKQGKVEINWFLRENESQWIAKLAKQVGFFYKKRGKISCAIWK